MQNRPVGIFDSGVGGTSIFKEIHQLLPYESIIYLADSRNAPYGDKTADDIKNLSEKNTRFLLSMNCKLIVVACNTATTNAISYLRANYNVPFIGIEPAIKPAALQTKTGCIGILATKGTLASDLFHKTTNLYSTNIRVIEQIGTGIVELIEEGKLYSEDMRQLLKTYLRPMISAQIDHLVLGCTHYPYLIPILKELLPEHVKIIDSGEAVARQTKHILNQNNLLNTSNAVPAIEFYTNTNPEVLQQLLENKFNVTYKDF
jgi:glutamate racemase